jgi:TonB-dependent SusC/RagA subfamily outer membrane receptor
MKRKNQPGFKGLLILFLSFMALSISAQTVTISGTVTDDTGFEVIGATITIVGNASYGTVTDTDGKYTLPNVPANASLQFSYVGMKTQIIPVNGRTTINVVLVTDTEILEEVVVTGYGGVQKAKTMTASASSVNVSQLAKLPVTSISEGLGGRVTGVITQQSSGAPGENVKIWIRGGEKILYVIDDVVMESSQGNAFFNRLRPDDIASMSILKDASATAVYGPRAANGVVVIATKRGQEGAPIISANQKVSIMTPSYRAKGLSAYEYAQARNEVEFASFQENPTFNNTALSKYYMGDLWQKGYNREDIRSMVNEKYGMTYTMDEINDLFDPNKTQGGNIQDYFSTYDPWDMFNHTQPMYQTNVSLRGGSERLTYYSSLGYMDQQ